MIMKEIGIQLNNKKFDLKMDRGSDRWKGRCKRPLAPISEAPQNS